MRKRKLLLHTAFWVAYLLPNVFEIITEGIQTESLQKFWVLTVSLLIIAVAVFYILNEWLLPVCMQLKGWRRIFWISLPLLWVLFSYVHMETERLIQQTFHFSKDELFNFPDYLVGMFWFMVIAAGVTFSHSWYENQLKLRDVENLRVRAELEYLRYRVNPHFLFNTLNSLYALALDKSDKTPQVVLRLAQLMRYMLQDESQEVLLKSEIEYLQNYLELEQMRLGNHAQIAMNVEGEINGQMIAPMLLLPFVENSFKHGVNNSVQEGYVEVEVKVAQKELFFYVENSKRSKLLSASENKLYSGLGLMNVRRRLDLLYGAARYNLEIEETEDKYCVNLYLQLK